MTRRTIMKIARILAVVAVGSLLSTAGVQAAEQPGQEVTLTGRLACAMCVMKLKEARSCTNVLVVPQAGKDVVYGLVENQVTHAWDMQACEKAIPVKVTGTLTERGGKPAIAASRIEKS
jgi:hypothetical protein